MEILSEDDIKYCYPEEIFYDTKLTKYHICTINNGVFRNPVIDQCGHTYCEDCIKDYLDKRNNITNDDEEEEEVKEDQEEEEPKYTCPQNGSYINKDNLIPNITLRNMIDELNVNCLHMQKGCNWKGITANLLEHIRNECNEVRIKCLYTQCEEYIPRRLFDSHNEKCEYRPIKCNLCDKINSYNQMDDHLKVCDYYIVDCDQNCGTSIQRINIEEHKRNECPNTIIDCQFMQNGCLKKIKRSELKAHIQDSIVDHLFMMKDAINTMKLENEVLKKDHEDLNHSIKAINDDIQDMIEDQKMQEQYIEDKVQYNIVRWLRIPKICTKCNEAKNLGITKKLYPKSNPEFQCLDCINTNSSLYY